MTIPFTQYLLPDGKRVPTEIEMPEEIEALATMILSKGAHFDVEMLSTGMISLTCEKDDDLLSIELSNNGPEIVQAVEDLVRKAHRRLFPNV